MVERMEDVHIISGLFGFITKRLNFFDNEMYIAKIEYEDGTVTWDARLASGSKIVDGIAVSYNKMEDTREKEEEALATVIERLSSIMHMDVYKTIK